MSNTQVGSVYSGIIVDVIDSSRVDFEEGGVDEHVLEELRLVCFFPSLSVDVDFFASNYCTSLISFIIIPYSKRAVVVVEDVVAEVFVGIRCCLAPAVRWIFRFLSSFLGWGICLYTQPPRLRKLHRKLAPNGHQSHTWFFRAILSLSVIVFQSMLYFLMVSLLTWC